MTISSTAAGPMPWWTEPTKDQWMAWVAAWLGWTLDAFDFTILLPCNLSLPPNCVARPRARLPCEAHFDGAAISP